jgi:DNA-binding NarL/FixJ family response regulator
MKRELSPRQREIMRLIRQGKSDKEIASSLNLKSSTVRKYVELILARLNARNRAHASAIWD